MTTSSHEYASELELERGRLLRRRFLWMVGLIILLSLPFLPLYLLATPSGGADRRAHLLDAGWATLSTLLYATAAIYVVLRRLPPRATSRLALALISFVGLLTLPIHRVSDAFRANDRIAQREGRLPSVGSATTQTARSGGLEADPLAAMVQGYRRGYETGRALGQQSANAASVTRPSSASGAATTGPATHSVPVYTSSNSDRPSFEVTLSTPDRTRGTGAATRVTFSPDDGIPPLAAEIFRNPGVRTLSYGLYAVFLGHLIACLFMPWTLRESLIPGGASFAGFTVTLAFDVVLGNVGFFFLLGSCALVASSLVPGSTWCWWRHSQLSKNFRLKFESGRYRELRHELSSARRIHETCLPAQVLYGPVIISYAYRPMQDIGGDLLFRREIPGAWPDAPSRHLVVLLDVTGHGIAAALTVNRILGELERIVAESADPDAEEISPGAVIAALNSYTRLVLAEHGLYLSAVAFLLDPSTRTLTYASAGHPTAYLLTPGRPATDLESTAPLLGVEPENEFAPNERSLTLAPDQIVLACTDGATDTMLPPPDGRSLRTAGLRDLVAFTFESGVLSPAQLPQAVLTQLTALRQSDEPEDDTLLVVLGMP